MEVRLWSEMDERVKKGVQNEKKELQVFQYGEYHFRPAGMIPKEFSFKDIVRSLRRDPELNFIRATDGCGWSYEGFYEVSSEEN